MQEWHPRGTLWVFSVCTLLLSGCIQMPETPDTSNPPLASAARYEKLPSSKLAAVARRDAESDFNNGHLIMLTAGFPMEPSKQERYLHKHYRIKYFAVSGCVVSQPLSDAIQAYNARMTALIHEKYQKDVFTEAEVKTRGWF